MLDTTAAPTAPVLTPAQQAAQDVIERQDYITMLADCLPTLKAEHYAARYLMGEMTSAGDVQVLKKQFLKAAKRVTGGLPPFTEVALQLIRKPGSK